MAPIPTPPPGVTYNGHANGADPKANNERLQIVDEEKQFTFVCPTLCTLTVADPPPDNSSTPNFNAGTCGMLALRTTSCRYSDPSLLERVGVRLHALRMLTDTRRHAAQQTIRHDVRCHGRDETPTDNQGYALPVLCGSLRMLEQVSGCVAARAQIS